MAARDAAPTPGTDTERYLVVAADKPEDLGPFLRWTDMCRVPLKVAAELHQGRGWPDGLNAASESYRVVAADDCPDAVGLDPEAAAVGLDEIPVCGR